ncbi:MAG: diacylglycerol/lipid kinase family protein [Actinomycetota bacterium]
MRALVVVNHQATATSPRALDVMLSALRHDLEVEVAETDHRGHAVELARSARTGRLDLVIVLGGDGTVNEVVNGLLGTDGGPRRGDGGDDTDDISAPQAPEGRPLPSLAVVPGGSTNVLARNLGIPLDPVEATGSLLDAVRAGRRRPLGLGRLTCEGYERYFTFCVGAGFDADIVRAVEQRRAGGKRATVPLYATTAVRRFFAQDDRRHGRLTLHRPGQEPVDGIVLAIITNTAPWTYLGRRPLNPTPRASFDRGLDLFALTRLGLPRALLHVAQIAFAPERAARGRDVLTLHDQAELTLSAAVPVPLQVDGDYIGDSGRFSLQSVPGALSAVY